MAGKAPYKPQLIGDYEWDEVSSALNKMIRNLASEILERLQYLFIIGLATILTLYYVLIVTRPILFYSLG